MRRPRFLAAAAIACVAAASAAPAQPAPRRPVTAAAAAPAAAAARVRLITLDPGHFHAGLVQKFMYPGVDSVVHVYAPAGDDVAQHLARVEGFNARAEQPTRWREQVYTGPDYLERMLADKPGNVVVIAGNNARKTEYIARSVEAGLNVLADKPMVRTPADLVRLEEAFRTAEAKRVLLYDIMTERHEVTTALQRELSMRRALFGELEQGTPDEPAITKESVHHFSKTVAGAPLKRPEWFFDVRQEGEGIVDVTTHLVDLVQWEAFPEQVLRRDDVQMLRARRWTTPVSREQFAKVTGARDFPAYLRGTDVRGDTLHVYSNGEMTYRLRGVHARVSVVWNFEAPAGSGDTHFSLMRGTKAKLVIRQGAEQNYKPVLYVERSPSVPAAAHEAALKAAIASLQAKYPGVGVRREGEAWAVTVPPKFDVGHEAHFAQVTSAFLGYLRAGKLPAWEVPNMLVKYATIMQAYTLARSAWARDAASLSWKVGDSTVWRFSYDAKSGKPFFDPVALGGGGNPSLTNFKPEDHPWHYGLWFSWKYINGLNYWEEDRASGRAAGGTRWDTPQIDARPDGSATIRMDLTYRNLTGQVALAEERELTVSAPAADGGYTIDWSMRFTAGARGAVLDRTPMPGEPEGAVNGGYAGLSVRLAPSPLAMSVVSNEGPVAAFESDRARPAALAVAANFARDGHDAGALAILSDPANAGAKAPWYVINAPPPRDFRFINASVLAPSPRTLPAGTTWDLRYRVALRRAAWTRQALDSAVRQWGGGGARRAAPPAMAAADAPFENEIRGFEREDRLRPPARGGVVFFGSSSFRLWSSIHRDFAGVPVINRGFGGSRLEDLVRYVNRVLIPYRPRLVVVYGGDNDILEGRSPEDVLVDYRTLVRHIHDSLPATRIAFVSIKPSPSRLAYFDRIRKANDLVRAFTARDPRLAYVDVFTPMLDAEGRPRPELFQSDMLHMNEQGYAIWTRVLTPHLR